MKTLYSYDGSMSVEKLIKHMVILWEEDDAMPPDRELLPSAFSRITGHKWADKHYPPIVEVDDGDCCYSIYREGWVAGYSYEGGFMGILIDPKSLPTV